MTKLNDIIYKLKEYKYNDIESEFKKYIIIFFNNWFIKLNKQDLEILIEITFFLIIRIKKLFFIDDSDLIFQFTKNNNQDIKAITFLYLPYLNADGTNIYNNLYDLNEIICSDKINDDIYLLDKNTALKKYFKYSTIGLGLVDISGNINLKIDDEKTIYKIIYTKLSCIINTLSIINGKMYINWINITPITLEINKKTGIHKYKESKIYLETKNKINDEYLYHSRIDHLNYNGLYIGEFYNVYRNIYYENIKKIKWTIFTYTVKNKKTYLIQYLHNYLNLNLILEHKNIDVIDISIKLNMINKIRNYNFDNVEYEIWKNFIIFMVNNYSKKKIIFNSSNDIFKNLNNKFTLNSLDDETNDNDFNNKSNKKIREITNDDINIFLQNIDFTYIWDFLSETLIILQSTIYSRYLIKNNNIETIFFELVDNNNNRMNLKNLYNIAKTLSYNDDTNNNWELECEKFDSIKNQKRFWRKFRNNRSIRSNWLNIKNNLNIEYNRSLSNSEYNIKLTEILSCWEHFKFDLVWEYLIINGLLNEFKVDRELTDNKKRKNLQKNLKEKMKKNPEWKEAYYYITNKKFSELDKIKIKKSDYELIQKEYFELFEKELKWYSFYAMDWVSQINFYNHYLNNRVLLVTGDPGQGKSTQVPKLFMYSVKMLDYKVNGKVVSTAPRINVTQGNSEWISQEAGVPNFTPHLKLNKIKTDNYYIQYKYSYDSHIKKNCSHLTYNVTTDGSLFEELITNALLKEKIYDRKRQDFEYTTKNLYDIIIIDESHEHNTYMDLLTTIIRNSIYFNNDIKLVIMSATLEEDEPIYRRYFRYINDNVMYPIQKEILNQITNKYELINRIYLDRRYHISPPGETSQYKITEIYSHKIIDDNKLDTINYNITLKESYNIIKKICNETQKGDILLFANGQADILNSVKILNTITPEDVVALPYFSKLNERYKDIILNIDKTIGFIKNIKSTIYETWANENFIEESVPSGMYKRAIIIATNVAEASLTLSSLRYVVETGYTKTKIYNEKLGISMMQNEKISEASRKQRKGRTGRTAEGTVYYMYEKGSREKILPKFKICQENYEDIFLKLLKKEKVILNDEDKLNDHKGLVINFNYDPNNYTVYNYNILLSIYNNNNNNNEDNKNILKIILKQYNININDINNFWDPLYYPTELPIDIFNKRYESGFNIMNIFDVYGEFYLIHPYESKIKRNIYNQIIKYNNNIVNNNKLDEEIFSNMIDLLQKKMLLIDIEYKHNIKNIVKPYNLYIIEFYKYVNDISRSLNFLTNNNQAYVILASIGYDCLFDIVGIITLLNVIDNSIKNLITKDKLKKYNEQDREIEYIYDIIESFKNKFYDMNIFKITSLEYLYKKYFSLFKKICNIFVENYNKDKNNIPKDFDKILFEKLKNSYENNELKFNDDDMSTFQEILNIDCIISRQIFNDNINYKTEIMNWCKQYGINYDIIEKFIIEYGKNIIDILTITKNNDSKFKEETPIEFMKKFRPSFIRTLDNTSKYEKIIKSFIFGYPFQYGLKIDHGMYHITKNGYRIINTDIKINTCPYILYLFFQKSTDITKNNLLSMRITNRIKLEWLCSVLPIYFNSNNFRSVYLQDTTILEINGPLWDNICYKINNSSSKSGILFDNVIKSDYEILYKYGKIVKQNM
jgi:hypothetical protein